MKTKHSLIAVVVIVLLIPVDIRAAAHDYTFYRAGAGMTYETSLVWITTSLGYYVNPSMNPTSLDPGRSETLNTIRDGISTASTYVGGDRLDPHRFYFGYEVAASVVDRHYITAQLDLSLLGKMHYWLGDSRNYYGGFGVGFAYNELRDENDKIKGGLELGGHMFFASDVELGRRITIDGAPYYLTLTWTHRSNGGLAEHNRSLNPFILSLSGTF